MFFDLRDIVRPEWIVRQDSDSVTVLFKGKRGNHLRKPFSFPKTINIDVRFAEAIGLFAGDGDMHRKEKKHLNFVSIDVDIALFALRFLHYIGARDNDIRLTATYRDEKPLIEDVAKKMEIDSSRISLRYCERTLHVAYHIQVSGVVFRTVFEILYTRFFEGKFLEEPALRRGFLRGIFAAEGCVGINYEEGFINYMGVSMSVKEEEIVQLIDSLFTKEGIKTKTVIRAHMSSRELIITNWSNYLKAWDIDLFDRCERKKRSFVAIARQSKVFGYLCQDDLDRIAARYTQKEVAALVGSWQANVCRTLKGEHLFTLRQIRILEERGLSLPIQKLRVGNLTDLPYSEETQRLFLDAC